MRGSFFPRGRRPRSNPPARRIPLNPEKVEKGPERPAQLGQQRSRAVDAGSAVQRLPWQARSVSPLSSGGHEAGPQLVKKASSR
eukprot:8125963-Alexandrium_andersonii.AAC.1